VSCLITGGGSGIGRATALALVSSMPVVVVDINEAGLRDTADLLRVRGGSNFLVQRCDVRIPTDCQLAVERAEELGGLTDVVSAAGIVGRNEPILASTAASWEAIIGVNLAGPANLVRAALPTLLSRGGGDVILVSSAAALRGYPGSAAYSASKAGLLGLTHSLLADYGSAGVRVNCVCPGKVDTPMASPSAGRLPNATGRAATADELASVISWLVDDASNWVNGAVLPVDDGEHALSGRTAQLWTTMH
jgi:NAD(P)-dependent dehydrogenase (short-subunit alcohol dehydrogenase family)